LSMEGVDTLGRIGDCEAPRLIADAVLSGYQLARETNPRRTPGVPLLFRLAAGSVMLAKLV
jgi:hypothetical protein